MPSVLEAAENALLAVTSSFHRHSLHFLFCNHV